MYDFWYDYVKPKHGKNAKLCYMDTDNFTAQDIYKNIAEDFETRFDNSNSELDKAVPKGKKSEGN